MAKIGREKPPNAMVEKGPKGLRPVAAYDEELLGKISTGQLFELTPRSRRSNEQLRLYWLVLTHVVDATGSWPTNAHLHDLLVKECGYVTEVINPFTGEYEVQRDSVAFDAMPVDEFNIYMTTALGKLSEALGIDVMEFLPPMPVKGAAA